MMDQLIRDFPNQLQQAIGIGENAIIKQAEQNILKVYIAGMGGSAIGGNLLTAFVKDECEVPVIVGKSYQVPNFVDRNTLAIISSYSGNTEEILFALNQIIDTHAKIVCITSGGKLLQIAKEKGFDFIQLPGEIPSPRACLAYSVVQLFFILNKLNLISGDKIVELRSTISLLLNEQEDIQTRASRMASLIHGKIIAIYAEDRFESVALRFRQQLNENSKVLAWHHVVPEMNHNEIVGWKETHHNVAVILFRSKDEFYRNRVRMEFMKEVIQNLGYSIIEVYAKGSGLIQKSFYLIHLSDWISWYLADWKNVDAMEVLVIDKLKQGLSKLGFK